MMLRRLCVAEAERRLQLAVSTVARTLAIALYPELDLAAGQPCSTERFDGQRPGMGR